MNKASQASPSLCLVVPCFNEEEMLPTFLQTVIPQLETATIGHWQIVCVDDGSQIGRAHV